MERVAVPYVTEGAPHLLDDLHLFETGLERVGGGAHGIQHRLTGSLGHGSCLVADGPRLFGSGPCRLPGVPYPLLVLPDCFERVTMPVADLPRILCQSPHVFRLVPGRLGGDSVFFREPASSSKIHLREKPVLVSVTGLAPARFVQLVRTSGNAFMLHTVALSQVVGVHFCELPDWRAGPTIRAIQATSVSRSS